MRRLQKELNKLKAAGWICESSEVGIKQVAEAGTRVRPLRGMINFGTLDRDEWIRNERLPIRLTDTHAELY